MPETTKSPKSNGVKQGGRRKTQSRTKATVPSSQNVAVGVSDDDSDIENGLSGVDKSAKNNRRKRKEKEKVVSIFIQMSQIYHHAESNNLLCTTIIVNLRHPNISCFS